LVEAEQKKEKSIDLPVKEIQKKLKKSRKKFTSLNLAKIILIRPMPK